MLKFYMCVYLNTKGGLGTPNKKLKGGDMIAVFGATCVGRDIRLSF